MSLAVHNQDPDRGFKKVSVTKTHEDYRAKFCFFELLKHDGKLFFYFHSWYQKYGNALIVTYIAKTLQDTCTVLNILNWDYALKPKDQIIYEPEDISDLIQQDDFCEQIKAALVRTNLMITYRKTFTKDAPIFAVSFEPYRSESLVIVKPNIYLPKNLLPKALLRTEAPKKSLKDILGRGKKASIVEPDEVVGSDDDLGSICENV